MDKEMGRGDLLESDKDYMDDIGVSVEGGGGGGGTETG